MISCKQPFSLKGNLATTFYLKTMEMTLKNHFYHSLRWLFFTKMGSKTFDIRLLIGVCLLIFLALELSLPFNLPLVNDELYHVNDSVVEGKLETINPYSGNYKFLGHPPGYRISLLLWFKLFPGTNSSVRYFSFLLTVISLVMIFVISFRFSNFASSFIVPLFFLFSDAYLRLGSSVTGNMHEFMLLLICFFFYMDKKMRLMALFFCFLVGSRESGLSFAIAFFLMELDKKRNIKSVLISCLKYLGPGLVLFSIFAMLNYLDKGNMIAHPYAHGGLAHLPDGFGLFTFNDYKFKAFITLLNSLSFYIGGRCYLYVVGVIQFVLVILLIRPSILEKWKGLYLRLQNQCVRSVVIFSLSINAAYFLFYSLYGDHVLRDLIPCLILMPLSLYLFVFLISSHYFALVSIALMAMFFVERGFMIPPGSYAQSILKLKAQAQEMEERFEGLTVCYPWPFRLADQKVHGLFSTPFKTKFSCKEAHVWPIFKFQSDGMSNFVKSLIEEHDMDFVYSYKEVDWGLSAKMYKSDELVGYDPKE